MRSTVPLFYGVLLASCSPRPAAPAVTGATIPGQAAQVAESVPYYLDSTEACEFVREPQTWTPAALVREYVRRDGAGEFLAADPWLKSALTCYGHMPGWDEATIVAAAEIRPLDSTATRARFVVAYRIVGTLSDPSALLPSPQFEVDTFIVVSTGWGWRIDAPQLNAHILPAIAMGRWGRMSVADSIGLARLAAGAPPADSVPRVTLVAPGIAPEGPLADGPWLGLYHDATGAWTVRTVRIGEARAFDVCREDSVAVPSFDPPGPTLAFARTEGMVPGAVGFVAKGYFFVGPGDSLSFTSSGGTIWLRATGTTEDLGTGTAFHDYRLSISLGGRQMSVWSGEFGDEVPKVEWIGDLDGDGFPDLIFSAPTAGYSSATQLLLSRPRTGGTGYRLAGEVALTDC